ncbi:MAG: right-handed parallel beta-helix repeat-containing protein [Bacteroidota bacterium]
MKSKFLCLMALLCLLPSQFLWSQTTAYSEDELHELYWTYRNRFKLYFTHIGNRPGDCVPMSARIDTSTDNTWCNFPNGYIKYGDGTSQLGFYIALLATEFKLLKDGGKPTQTTLNELYYTLRTIRRLDEAAERYYNPALTTGVLNGFFLRDDVNVDTRLRWQKSNTTMTDADAYQKIGKDGNGNCNELTFTGHAPEMSKDQFACIIMGFALAKKFVTPDAQHDIFVKPTPADEGFFILQEMQTIVDRYMNFIFTDVTWSFDTKCLWAHHPFTLTLTRNLYLRNPVTNADVGKERGADLLDMIVPLCKAAQIITGTDYMEREFHYKTVHANSVCLPNIEDRREKIKDFRPSFFDGYVYGPSPINASSYNPSAADIKTISVFDFEGGENNLNIFGPLAAVVPNHWVNEDFRELCDVYNAQEYYLLNSIMCDSPDMKNYAFWINRFSTIGKKRNPFRWEIGNHYRHANSWQHQNRPHDKELEGFYGAYDFMLAYNLFKIKYPIEALLEYQEASCDCGAPIEDVPWVKPTDTTLRGTWKWRNPTIKLSANVNGSFNTLSSGTVVAERYHTDYIEKGISSFSYLSLYNYKIENTGVLHTKDNTVLCNGKQLSLQNGGKLIVGGDLPTEVSEFRVRKGTTLIIHTGGELRIKNNSRLIVEPGGVLLVDPSSSIVLDGANAILEIRGIISLAANGEFKPTGTGFVLFNNNRPDLNTELTPEGTYTILNEGGGGVVEFNRAGGGKMVEIASHTKVQVHDNVQFKITEATVECGIDAGFVLSCPVTIQRTIFTKIPTLAADYVHNALSLIGQDSVRIWNCAFNYAKTAVAAYIPGNRITITICSFSNCKKAIETWGGGGNFVGSTFSNNYITWTDLSARRFTSIEHNLFTNNQANVVINGALMPFVGFMGNIFKNNHTTILANNSSDVSLACNQFTGNSTNGIFQGNSVANASTRMPFQAKMFNGNIALTGHNMFITGATYPQRGLLFLKDSRYRFDDGYNSFINNYGNTPLFFYSLYSNVSRPVTGPTTSNLYTPNSDINFVNNSWNLTPVGNTFQNILDYNKNTTHKHFDLNFSNTQMEIYGHAKASTINCPVAHWNDALGNPNSFSPAALSYFHINGSFHSTSQVNPGGGDEIKFLYPTTPTTVQDGAFTGQLFHIAASEAVKATYNGVRGTNGLVVNLAALENLNDLLISTINVQLEDDKHTWTHAYNQYLGLLCEAKYSGAFLNNIEAENTHFTQAIALCDAILADNETQPESNYYFKKLHTHYDKGNIYSVFKHYTDALSVFSDMETFTVAEDINLLEVTQCVTEQEKLLHSGIITKYEYHENAKACLANISIEVPADLGFGYDSTYNEDSAEFNDISFIILPNPASTQIVLDINQLIPEAQIMVAVYNKFGVNMTGMLDQGLHTQGQYSVAIPLSSWNADVYTAIVFANGVPYSKHFVKINE